MTEIQRGLSFTVSMMKFPHQSVQNVKSSQISALGCGEIRTSSAPYATIPSHAL